MKNLDMFKVTVWAVALMACAGVWASAIYLTWSWLQ